jgi:3-methyladenine DNA glycosylase AlkC
MEPLKNMFGKEFYERLSNEFIKVYPSFNKKEFLKTVMAGIEERSLNQRMRHTTITLGKHLPQDIDKSTDLILKVAPAFKSHYTSFLFPDFISVYGLNNFDRSLEALKVLTSYGSSEFAIREFLKTDLDRTLKQMYKWSKDKDVHVRRLSSEGCRPRLPWSFNLPAISENPELTRPILENLKADPNLYVKKSVANHLNDFSRLQTDWMLNVIRTWDMSDPNTAWIIKHASRTLIKKGHAASLSVFDFEKNVKVSLENFKLNSSKLRIGDALEFSFTLHSLKKKTQKLVVDYAIHYAKSSGNTSRKVFKLKELDLEAGAKVNIRKSQSFKDFSTRKHYAGKHSVEILINGTSFAKKDFQLSL